MSGFVDVCGGCGERPKECRCLAGILTRIETFVRRFVVFGSVHQSAAVALWVVHVYAIGAAYATPYLRVKSVVEESGKSTLLEVLKMLLGDRAINTVSVTPSVVFRIRDKVGPVALLLDEADQTMRNRQDDGARDLLAIVNAGYVRSAVVLRNVGQSHEPKAFPAFGPAVISGIATLAPTTESRCIPIILDRKPPGQGERFLPFLPEIAEDATAIAAELEAWSTDDVVAGLRVARPTYPEGLRDRQIQGWWNLFAIADLAGEGWPSRARTAALALHVAAADDLDALSVGVLLLRHIREAFEEAGVDRLSTTDLLQLLVANEDGPWGRWWGTEVERSRSTDGEADAVPRKAASELAKHLRGFHVPPTKIRVGVFTPRGYLREDFVQVWSRYLPGDRSGDGTEGTHGTPLASDI